jgi:hypothetical protein
LDLRSFTIYGFSYENDSSTRPCKGYHQKWNDEKKKKLKKRRENQKIRTAMKGCNVQGMLNICVVKHGGFLPLIVKREGKNMHRLLRIKPPLPAVILSLLRSR